MDTFKSILCVLVSIAQVSNVQSISPAWVQICVLVYGDNHYTSIYIYMFDMLKLKQQNKTMFASFSILYAWAFNFHALTISCDGHARILKHTYIFARKTPDIDSWE